MSGRRPESVRKRICVFCGSSPGARPEYAGAARDLGEALVGRGIGLVYGGANVGVMRELADAVLRKGGEVVGVLPKIFADKVAHTELSALHVVGTMHERKQLMSDLSDAFIALPGGIGTLEEFFEALSWGQIGFHCKPCGLLNTVGYYRTLLDFLDHAVAQRFIRPQHRAMILVDESPEGLLGQIETYCAPTVEKWLDRRPPR